MDRSVSLGAIDASLTDIGRLARTRQASARRQRTAGVALDDSAVFILKTIKNHGPLRLGQLSTLVEIEVSQLSKKVRRLVDEDLVAQAIDPTERRAVLLEATPKGRRAFQQYRKAADKILAEAFMDWSEADLQEAADVLARLLGAFRAADAPRHATRAKVPVV